VKITHHSRRYTKLQLTTEGKSNTISTSKTKKITAIKKNRKEKGVRAPLMLSNPHSKGELFSRPKFDLFIKTRLIKRVTTNKSLKVKRRAASKMIIFSA